MSTSEYEESIVLDEGGVNMPLNITSAFTRTNMTRNVNFTLPYIPRLPDHHIVPALNWIV